MLENVFLKVYTNYCILEIYGFRGFLFSGAVNSHSFKNKSKSACNTPTSAANMAILRTFPNVGS